MASLERDPTSKRYRLRFRYGGREFKRSLRTANSKLAQATLGRVTETLMLVETGRLRIPMGSDPVTFILTDGKRTDAKQERLLTVAELFQDFAAARIPGAKEGNTIATEDLHSRHLKRLLGPKTLVPSLSVGHLQDYVRSRLTETRRGRPIASETVTKEVATFRLIWNWGLRNEVVEGPAPIQGLVYPKRDEKPPFMTWAEIERITSRSSLDADAEQQYWACLYLDRHEIHAVLEQVERNSRCPFLYPLVAFIAHTGARLSEALRTRVHDIDLKAATVLIREKKRSRVRSVTYRRVSLTPMLAEVLRCWLLNHPGGTECFVVSPFRDQSGAAKPVDKYKARDQLELAVRDSKWSRIRGYHLFRHSFASNLATAGVDQRIIDEFMGHQTDEMRRRYRHLFPATKHEAILNLLPPLPKRGETVPL